VDRARQLQPPAVEDLRMAAPVAALRSRASLDALRADARHCKACPLWERATQTVFGEGPARPRLVLVGEQPGDVEDREGRPFVGPAGRVLDDALEEAGIDRRAAYVTNAVKHFKWRPAGKRRIHDKPNERELTACRPWLDAELAALTPDLVVCLGATAAQSLLGKQFRVTRERGRLLQGSGIAPSVLATVHPSSILRQQDSLARRAAMDGFVSDLRLAAASLEDGPRSGQNP
jgi:DNA polymerase